MCKDKETKNIKSAIKNMEKISKNLNHELEIINDRCIEMEDRREI